MSDIRRSLSQRIMHYVSVFNALGLAILILLIAIFLIAPLVLNSGLGGEYGNQPFGHDQDSNEYGYSGRELNTPDGMVISYSYLKEGVYEESESKNITLFSPRTGRQRLVLPKDSEKQIVSWKIVYKEGQEKKAIGYMARVATPENYDRGFVDIIVGNLPNLEQKTIAKDVQYIDLVSAYGANGLSLIMWPNDKEAQFLVVDLEKLNILKKEKIDLPKPEGKPLSLSSSTNTMPRNGRAKMPPAKYGYYE